MEIEQPRPMGVEAGFSCCPRWAAGGLLEREATRIITTGSPRLRTGDAGAQRNAAEDFPEAKCLTLRGASLL